MAVGDNVVRVRHVPPSPPSSSKKDEKALFDKYRLCTEGRHLHPAQHLGASWPGGNRAQWVTASPRQHSLAAGPWPR